MATQYARPLRLGDERFNFRMACAMALVIVAGFSLNLAMGRSSFAVPLIYHLHAGVFFAWVTLFVVQTGLVNSGHIAVHRKLGLLAVVIAPLMIALGLALIRVSMQRTGGPFFFDQNEFLVSNPLQLLLFGGFVTWALARRHQTDWHRRLMLGAMAVLTGPGLGRIVPMPLFIPWAWWVAVGLTMIWPLIGMAGDHYRHARVHPAWFWVLGLMIATHLVGEVIAYSPIGYALTEQVLAGTPGAQRPMQAFMP